MNKKYDLVVIGGGSAGMSAAVSAYDNGIKDIIIIEKEAYLGGILLQCIHNGFGLHTFKEELTGPEYANRFEIEVKNRGIDYRLSSFVSNITKLDDGSFYVDYSNDTEGMVRVECKAIVCGTGCSERTRGAIGINGDRCSGVMTAGMAQKYLNIEGYMAGKRVFILGSGDIGLIMARRMTLEGAKVLGVAELMPYSNGLNRNIVQCLNDYNIPLYLHHTVKEVIGKERLEKVVLVDVDEHLKQIPGSEMVFDCDTLLLSVGLLPNNPLLVNLGVKMHRRTRGPIVDECLMTSVKGIFACGNSLHVHDLVDYVSQEASMAGSNAAKYILGNLQENKKINIVNGNGVGYVLPQMVDLNNVNQVKISFRVTTPYKDVRLVVKQGEKILKNLPKNYLVPAEMENVLIDKALIENMEDISVEVCNA